MILIRITSTIIGAFSFTKRSLYTRTKFKNTLDIGENKETPITQRI